MMETKAEIRKKMLAVRNGLAENEIVSKSEAIVHKVLKTPEYEEASNILLYADYNHEVMTHGIFEDALKHRKKIYYPKTDPLTNQMEFYQVISVRQLEHGYKGILEPKEEQPQRRYKLNKNEDTLIIVPGVAFDILGYRLGCGKGFYDRFLSGKRQISTMALAFSCQILDELPYESHDIKMDKIVTEEIIYSFLRI